VSQPKIDRLIDRLTTKPTRMKYKVDHYRWTGKNMEGIGRSLFQFTILTFAWRIPRKTTKNLIQATS